jgi:hypothetical protein
MNHANEILADHARTTNANVRRQSEERKIGELGEVGWMRESGRPATMSDWSCAGGCPSGVPCITHDHIAWIWLRIWRLVKAAATGAPGD